MAPPPSALLAFPKVLFFHGDQPSIKNIEHMFDWEYALLTDMSEEWRRVQVRIADTVSGDPGDDQLVTFDVMNYTAGAVDSSWDTGDYDIVKGRLSDFFTGYASHMQTHARVEEIRFYRMAFNPAWPGSSPPPATSPPTPDINPFLKSGAPEKSYALSIGGLIPAALPPQVAMSVTEIVPVRRSWGRFYLPSPGASEVAAGVGRWTSASVNAISVLVFNLYSGLAESEMFPIVPNTYASRNRVAAWQTVSGVRIDDVPDVIRRRRFQHATVQVTNPIPAPLQQPA